jgi:spore maturation protein CgeB
MKVLYVGPMDSHGSCYSRFKALKALEANIDIFDTDQFWKGWQGTSNLRRSIEFRIFFGPLFKDANKELLRRVEQSKPDLVWIDKGFWIWPSTLRNLRNKGIFLVHHITDALYPQPLKMKWMNLLIRLGLPHYDVYFTTNADDYERLRNSYSKNIQLTQFGYDHDRFSPEPLTDSFLREWKSQLLFVGHYEFRTEKYVRELIKAKLPIRVFGQGWERAKDKRILEGFVEARPLLGKDYANALKAADIGLGFLSEWNYNQTTIRSFEIPASGTFLLGMRTPRHQVFFTEGKEAEFFGDARELCEKAHYYLENEKERTEIARKGYLRCQRSEYAWVKVMEKDWERVLRIKDEMN